MNQISMKDDGAYKPTHNVLKKYKQSDIHDIFNDCTRNRSYVYGGLLLPIALNCQLQN
jgi:hypothetical protein